MAPKFPYRKPAVKPHVSNSDIDHVSTLDYFVSMAQQESVPAVRFFLAEWRIERRLTQEQLAELMAANKAKISKLETGMQQMTGEWLARTARALNLRPEDLLISPEEFRARSQALNTEQLLEFSNLLSQLPPEDQEQILQIARLLARAQAAAKILDAQE